MISAELLTLVCALLLHVALMCLFALRANLEIGPSYTLGPRDHAPPRPPSKVTGRLQRALQNSFESLVMFAPAVMVVTLAGAEGGVTTISGWVFVVARLLYIPAYAMGLSPWRSIIWAVGFFATVAMILAAVF
ncbi:MAPEG family protein [Rhodobacteraceae bacterium]|nr:MAPEG family protein [Paracoccaceae bacterium]